MSIKDSFGKCALLVSHPGHEIRVHGWLEKTQPVVFVLTDGSGRVGRSRIESTTRLLAQVGARPGAFYGRLSDRALYRAVLRCDLKLFQKLTIELANALVRERFDFVLADAAEGEILAHDLWRGMVDAALAIAARRLHKPIANYEFQLEDLPIPRTATCAVQLLLNDTELSRKISAARTYTELKADVDTAFAAHGEDAFRLEYLEPANGQMYLHSGEMPRYECHGERLVSAGIYPETVKYKQHVAPVLTELQRLQWAA